MRPPEFLFESMHLQVGVRLQFITYRRLKPVQYFSTLIGYIKDEYLIVKMPMENGVPIGLVEGERVTIRVFSGVNVCSFDCTVERIFGRPLLYLHLSFPETIQGTLLRTSMRVKADLPATISGGAPDEVATQCVLANVSVNGARIDTRARLAQDSGEMLLSFMLTPPPDNQPVQVRARVLIRNVNPVQEAFAYGVEFIELEPTYYMLLQNLTYEALLADRQKIV
jgi:c-di-GMP-binding flagellar brake protein YcgR